MQLSYFFVVGLDNILELNVMGRLPEELINQIKQEVDLVQLIQSQGYQLKKNGKDYLLNCP